MHNAEVDPSDFLLIIVQDRHFAGLILAVDRHFFLSLTPDCVDVQAVEAADPRLVVQLQSR